MKALMGTSEGVPFTVGGEIPMAISVTINNPIKVTGTESSAAVVTANTVMVQKIVWSGVTTAGHKLSITDTAGNQIAKMTVDLPGTAGLLMVDCTFPVPHPCVGLKIDDMDSGEVLIYLVTKGI